MKISINNFLITADLVTSTKEIHNGKLYFCAVLVVLLKLLT